MFSAAKLHAMYRVANAQVRTWPFPHIHVENILPAEFYAELRRNMIEDEGYTRLVDTGRVGSVYSDARFSLFPKDLANAPTSAEKKQFWQTVFDTFTDDEFSQLWLSVFGPTIKHKLKTLPAVLTNGRPANELGFYNEIFLMRDRTTYSLGPHTDSPRKLVSVLFYLPPDDSATELGTSAYIPKDRAFTCPGGPHHPFDKFDLVATMPYKPNSLVAFPQSPVSFHGVEPVTRAGAQRDLMLFDLKIRTPPKA